MPSKRMTSDQWARDNRVYPASTGWPGPRNPGLTPYRLPIVHAVESGRWKRVVDVTAAQTGKTESQLDLIGHRCDQRPAPILYVGPNKQFLNEQFEPRLMQMLEGARSLRGKVGSGKRMTKTRKIVAGVPVRLAHGGSSTALKSDPAALAIVDEYDEMLENVKKQGDPLGLVEARGDTFSDFTVMISSTPSVGNIDTETDPASGLEFWKFSEPEEIESPIWRLFQEGTRWHWCWQCPQCHGWFVPRFKLLDWQKAKTPIEARRMARLLCPISGCGGIIEETDKEVMNEGGRFVAPGQTVDARGVLRGEPPESSTASFLTSGLASPFVTFGDRAEAYVRAQRSGERAKIQSATNAQFGDLYAPGSDNVPESVEVYRLKISYKRGQVPVGVVTLTCAVDVQKNRLVYVIRGWGARSTSWLIQHGESWGPTDQFDVWNDLDDLLKTRIAGLRIRICIIDSGFRPGKKDAGPENMVYEFCRQHQRNCRPAKGASHAMRTPLIVSKLEVKPDGKRVKYGLDLLRINTDWSKLWVHERIRWPVDQLGAFYLPEDVSDDYCLQLLSEARLKSPDGRPTWIQLSRNNHYLDCEAMNWAAGELLNVQRIRRPEVSEENTEIEGKSFDDRITDRNDQDGGDDAAPEGRLPVVETIVPVTPRPSPTRPTAAYSSFVLNPQGPTRPTPLSSKRSRASYSNFVRR